MVSKALVVGAYHKKLEEIAAHPDVDLVAVVPTSWREGAFERRLERTTASGFQLVVSPIAANGNFHLFFFPQLGKILDEHRPDIVHVDEEPYNFATFMAVRQSRARRIPSIFFTWQNLNRRYPLPFAMMERCIYRTAACGIAGTNAAARVMRAKGYTGPLSVIPQFGVDPARFQPSSDGSARRADGGPFTIGFAGRLVPEKGVELLVDACARLSVDFRLVIIGEGPSFGSIQERMRTRGVESKVEFRGSVRSTDMPEHLVQLDALVLPSLTRPNWAEQFGRILVEAMACGVPVIGSTCGEIADVIGDGGLVVPEGDTTAIVTALERLLGDSILRADLAQRGRQRVLDQFTHERIAGETVALYRRWARRAIVPA